jgi:hypothetical protein
MKHIILSLLVATSVVAEESTLEKFGALVIRLHQGTENLFVGINSHTWAETEEKREYLDDGYFIKAMKELQGKPVHRLQMRKSRITDSGLDALAQFPNLKKLEISNSKITDEGIKKIVMYCPQLVYLNVWGITNITDKSLIHLRDLWTLKDLYLFGTSVTWDAANKHRGVMQAMAAQEDLTVYLGSTHPTLYAFSNEEHWKATYQKNVALGRIDPNYIDKYPAAKAEIVNDKKYEDDLAKEATDPVLAESPDYEETP